MTRDELRSVLPGGKHHDVAMKWVADDAAVLQANHGDSEWHETNTPSFIVGREYRIKPQVLRYRVAIMRNLNNTLYPSIADSDLAAETLSGCHHFVKWAGDWRETEL